MVDTPPAPGRRAFLRTGLTAAAALTAAGPLTALSARTAGAAPMSKLDASPDYGPLIPARDHTTGLALLSLPRGFEYLTFGWTGDAMSDGVATPGAHDGMAAFRRGDGKVAIVRNHEVGAYRGAFTETAYNPTAGGGTTTLVFDPDKGEFTESWASLGGTIRNCAGGPTPWGTWLTCEETTEIAPNGTRHGYVFEVPFDGAGDPEPLRAMGRFSHEAVAVDPSTGYVYLTEDATPSGLYRYIPRRRGNLAAGGDLQMLAIESAEGGSYSTYTDGTGTEYRTSWVPIANPDYAPGETRPALQGAALGGAVFRRLEGAWWGNDRLYIVSTSGGPKGQGQVFEYDPATERMRVLFASPDAKVLNNPDNLCVSPRGGIVLCEDGSESEYIHGLTTDGQIFPFALNTVVIPEGGVPGKSVRAGDYSGSEWCGSTFEPKNGNWLFFNAQSPGITFAVTGPWRRGSL
ncbi:PhoX family protein [Actinokineospora fastidiosa]|uniref:Phosphatase n=1 Tax=Actinokineospora fastidiosa TaxID=1816 RepID=A0A918GER6_9PSEU|nr:alkaline phosphatase PhoX [Actinokineospora fastidiosa]GGS31063.1 phosphatase [Actinokineospora fastidiosa]